MELKLITVSHPFIPRRDITLILQNNDLHLPAARFLVKEARNGGRHGSIGGRTSHLQRAKQLRELFYHLAAMGIDWRDAIESDIRAIRNAMLHWDSNNNLDLKTTYSYQKIANDSMNTKLGVWFKFYRYMHEIGESYNMTLTTRLERVFEYRSQLLDHINQRNNEHKFVEVWDLKIPGSPKRKTYKVITRKEFDYFCKELQKIDITYVMIAKLMATTGLRINAALNVTPHQFKNYFKYLNTGKTLESKIKFRYVSKGDLSLECQIPIKMIADLQKEYLSRIYIERMKKYSERSERGLSEYNSEAMWLLNNGREVNYSDIIKVFTDASKALGRTIKPITPHWLRHSFATWALIDYSKRENILLKGIIPDTRFIIHLSELLGHANESTTMKYVQTALTITELERLENQIGAIKTYDGPLMTYQLYKEDPGAQEIVKKEAMKEFGNIFDEKQFDAIKYAISRGMLVDDAY